MIMTWQHNFAGVMMLFTLDKDRTDKDGEESLLIFGDVPNRKGAELKVRHCYTLRTLFIYIL